MYVFTSVTRHLIPHRNGLKLTPMKTAKPYVKRRLQTFKFAGRAPRGLYWKKEVYREWFEWAKLAGKYPGDWGQLESFLDFEDWWRHPNFGFELFCEPPERPAAELLAHVEGVTDDRLLIAIDRQAAPEKALLMVRNLLKKQLRPQTIFESRARYSPSKSAKYLKIEVLRRYRFAYTLMLEGKTRREIAPELMKFRKSKQLPAMRVITRDLTTAKKILKNVSKGIFPGNLEDD